MTPDKPDEYSRLIPGLIQRANKRLGHSETIADTIFSQRMVNQHSEGKARRASDEEECLAKGMMGGDWAIPMAILHRIQDYKGSTAQVMIPDTRHANAPHTVT